VPDGQRDADLLIRGGAVLDGTGVEPRCADVAVSHGRIVAVGDLDSLRANREIDASGLTVAPGFVDLHSHADLILLAPAPVRERLLSARILQGVTTIVVGNCGLGTAPATPEAAAILARVNGWMTPEGVDAGPLRVGEYLDCLESGGVPLNVGTLLPHGPVRISAMGLADGEPTAEQMTAMLDSVHRGLDEGALGLSTGLIYPPGMYSSTEELITLARVVAGRDRLFTSHVRGSSETLLRATAELIEIGRESGARVHHSHLEAVGERFWPDAPRALELEDRARADGVRISHDVFPYSRAATMMSAIFPPWSLQGGLPGLLDLLRQPGTRERIRHEVENRVPEWPPWQPGGWPHNLVEAVGWDGILVASVGAGGPAGWVGRSLADIAAAEGGDPFDRVAELMISQQGRVGQLVDEISGRGDRLGVLPSILAHPAAAVISDAEDYGRGSPHPAHAGAFVRALRLGRDRSLLALEEMVRRMTSYPASLIGLEDRGVVREGAAADLVVFDPEAVADRATWSEPRRGPAGVDRVVLNGRVVAERGRYRGGLHGAVLRARPTGCPEPHRPA
jgi:N-acyl-D-aspartate/D-glutamate deacylase